MKKSTDMTNSEHYEIHFWNFELPFPMPLYPFCTEEVIRHIPRKIPFAACSFLQILSLPAGSMHYIFRDREIMVNAGDILSIPPWVPFYFESYSTKGYYHKQVIEIKGSLLKEYLESLDMMRVWHWKSAETEEFEKAFHTIANYLGKSENHDIPEIIACSVRLLHFFSHSMNRHREQKENTLLARAQKIIDGNLNIPINLEMLADKLNISRSTLGRLFRSGRGMSPREYWIRQKTEAAEYLLLHTDLSVKEIAFRLGYSSQFHFSSEFRRLKGLSPIAYRKRGFC